MVEIAPSMMGADFGDMRRAAELVAPESGYLHMDVMDGHFVPNLTMGSDLVKALKGIAPMDVHLMITDPCDFIDDFCEAGADIISVHTEANKPKEALQLIKSKKVTPFTKIFQNKLKSNYIFQKNSYRISSHIL